MYIYAIAEFTYIYILLRFFHMVYKYVEKSMKKIEMGMM
jgi:hypothetical protein